MSYTFEIWDSHGQIGSIALPTPSRWYLRLALRVAAWLWMLVAAAREVE